MNDDKATTPTRAGRTARYIEYLDAIAARGQKETEPVVLDDPTALCGALVGAVLTLVDAALRVGGVDVGDRRSALHADRIDDLVDGLVKEPVLDAGADRRSKLEDLRALEARAGELRRALGIDPTVTL